MPQPSRMDFVINPGSRVDPLDGPKGGLQPGAKPGGKPKVSEAAAELKRGRDFIHGTVRRPSCNTICVFPYWPCLCPVACLCAEPNA